MNTALSSFLISLGVVTLAEMGDKTQLLAIAFSARYKPIKVMIGVFIATVLNHALAVVVGSLLAGYENPVMELLIQLLASLSFVFFGLWSIRGDRLEGEEKRKSRFGAIATVSIAFFIAELGDKTQLATIALAAKYPASPVFILMGTTAGMLVADGIGIFLGAALCRWVPERTIKLVSAAAFIVFGLIGSYQLLTGKLGLTLPVSLAIVAVLGILSAAAAWFIIRHAKKGQTACDVINK